MASTSKTASGLPVIVAGGGIGGLAAALMLAKSGFTVHVLEQATEFSEIGAGLQLGPNANRLLRKWGVHDVLAPDLVAPAELRMMDGLSGQVIGQIPLGEAFEQRFGAPYYVAHRGDLHRALFKACSQCETISLKTQQSVAGYSQSQSSVTVNTDGGDAYEAAALIGADGIWSKVRAQLLDDGHPTFANHTCYRTLLTPEEMPEDAAWNAATLWAGAGTHLVHYPISGRRHYNIVAVFHSDWRSEGWNEEGDKDELLWRFRKGCETVKRILGAGTSYRKWALADREPVKRWSDGRVTLLGDAAHAVLQYFAQGAAMAIEDADCLAENLKQHGSDMETALLSYEKTRQPRTAKLHAESRYLGGVYHARGIKRFFRNRIMRAQTPEDWYRRVEWVYSGP